MVNLILFLLASIGLSHILVESTVAEPIRQWFKGRAPQNDENGVSLPPNSKWQWLCGKISYVLGCYQCSGAWTGWLMALLLLTQWTNVGTMHNLLINMAIVIPAGFAASIASNFAAILLTYLEANAMVK
jgi:hypothetical protein